MEMADPMCDRDQPERAEFAVGFAGGSGLLRCGENVGHLGLQIPFWRRRNIVEEGLFVHERGCMAALAKVAKASDKSLI
jgi:hypothetical protein